MLRVPKAFQSKTKAIAHVPYTIKSIHSNGTVTIDKYKSCGIKQE
ncbi:hypothetical protein L914_17864 [Phytophthora nicotianae]|uniref:Uncharacterized protein n=1 Tax=Phytophthora nicotianae TaxID=4792 RepID=W2MI97_PHYNI|nr:hypothetical protein L914_17864 [Phytophthora nicotianae]